MNRRALLGAGRGGPPDHACWVLDTSQCVVYCRTKVQIFGKGDLRPMSRKRQTSAEHQTHAPKPKPTFLLELPLRVNPGQAKRLRAHLEAARQFYNAILS